MLLSELVARTLEAASVKTASVQVAPAKTPDVADLIFPKEKVAAEAPAPTPATKTASDQNSVGLAAHGMKIAKALGVAADVLLKVAQDPAVTAAADPGAVRVPKATSNSVPSKYEAGGPGALPSGHMPDSEADPVSRLAPLDNTPGKTASLRLVNAKLADAEVLSRYGQKEAAHRLRMEAAVLQKQASDFEDGPSASGNPAVQTMAAGEGGGGGPSFSNERMISMTRAEARNPTTAEVKKVITEHPKLDPATAAAVGTAEGVKASAAQEFMQEYVKKAEALLTDPSTPDYLRVKAAAALNRYKAA